MSVNVEAREHQLKMSDICDEILLGRYPDAILAVVTPGGGKSAIPPIIATKLIPNIAERICIVVPRITLKYQGEKAFFAQWTIDWLGGRREVRSADNSPNPSRGTNGYITTYQSVLNDPDLHRMEFERHKYILVLDECHHVEDGGSWHKSLEPLVDSSVLLIMLSGTIERGNGGKIAFLDYERSEDGKLYPSTPVAIEYGRKDALSERAIIPIEFKHLDASVEWVSEEGIAKRYDTFDDVKEEEMSDAIYVSLSTDYAYGLLTQCVTEWMNFRKDHPSSRMLVVAHRQWAANDYTAHLKKYYPAIKTAIAISDESKEAELAIQAFRDKGEVECLVTVGMAYEGLDVPGITHIACLTNIRSKPWIEQMLARGVRVDPKGGNWESQRCYAYVSDDPYMAEIIGLIKEEQIQGIEEGRKPRKTRVSPQCPPGPEDKDIVPINGLISGARSTELDGFELSRQETSELEYRIRVANLSGQVSPIQLYKMMNANPAQGGILRSPMITTSSDKEQCLREKINNRATSIDRTEYRCVWGTCNREIKRRFDKKREVMTIDELQAVWAFINSRWPTFRAQL